MATTDPLDGTEPSRSASGRQPALETRISQNSTNLTLRQAIYKVFARWVGAGVFEQMRNRLCQQWPASMGRAQRNSDRRTVHTCFAARWRKRIYTGKQLKGKAQSRRQYDGCSPQLRSPPRAYRKEMLLRRQCLDHVPRVLGWESFYRWRNGKKRVYDMEQSHRVRVGVIRFPDNSTIRMTYASKTDLS